MTEDQEITEHLRQLHKSCNEIGGVFIAVARKEEHEKHPSIATGYAIVAALAYAISTIVEDQIIKHEEIMKLP
jgi:drug/metabolite transporter (DMT)-like permease